jgi:hypothetical protein
MSKKETVEELANRVLEESNKPGFIDLLKDEINSEIFKIMSNIASKNADCGPMEISVRMGRACYDMGKEDMKKELAEKLGGGKDD